MTLWTLMFPFDVIKSNMQVSQGNANASFYGTMRHIYAKQGWFYS